MFLAHFNFKIFGMFIYVGSYPDPLFWSPPNPPSTWLGFPCCPGKPQKLRHPCNRTWEPWHFTSKKKRVDPGWVFPLQKWKGWDLYKPQKGNYEGCIQGGIGGQKKEVRNNRKAGDFFFGGGDFDGFGDIWAFFSQTCKPSMFLFLCVQEFFPAQETPPWKSERLAQRTSPLEKAILMEGCSPSFFKNPSRGPMTSFGGSKGGRMLRPSWHVEPWEVDFDRRDRAGRGGFGEVFVGHWAGQQAAVKEADKMPGKPLGRVEGEVK